MIKFTAMFLIFTASVLTGTALNSKMSMRVSELEKVIFAVSTVKQRISYFLEPLDSIFGVLKKENKLFSGQFANDFSKGWEAAITDDARALKPDEREVIAHFGSTLGRSDRDGQLALCDAMTEKLLSYRKRACADREKYSRIVAVLPVFAALTVIILFL